MQPFQYIIDYYKVPACIGRRVVAYGKPGIIAEDFGHHIGILLDEDKPTKVRHYHPVDGIEYLGMGEVRQMTRSQRNYRDFLREDSSLDFGEWLRFKQA